MTDDIIWFRFAWWFLIILGIVTGLFIGINVVKPYSRSDSRETMWQDSLRPIARRALDIGIVLGSTLVASWLAYQSQWWFVGMLALFVAILLHQRIKHKSRKDRHVGIGE